MLSTYEPRPRTQGADSASAFGRNVRQIGHGGRCGFGVPWEAICQKIMQYEGTAPDNGRWVWTMPPLLVAAAPDPLGGPVPGSPVTRWRRCLPGRGRPAPMAPPGGQVSGHGEPRHEEHIIIQSESERPPRHRLPGVGPAPAMILPGAAAPGNGTHNLCQQFSRNFPRLSSGIRGVSYFIPISCVLTVLRRHRALRGRLNQGGGGPAAGAGGGRPLRGG
jgi:hypothetical protein